MNQHTSAQSPGAVLHVLVCTPPPREGHPGVAGERGFPPEDLFRAVLPELHTHAALQTCAVRGSYLGSFPKP